MPNERIDKVFHKINNCLSDDFQNWLVAANFMSTRNEDINPSEDIVFSHEIRQWGRKQLTALEMLLKKPKRIAPVGLSARELYGEDTPYQRKKANAIFLGIKLSLEDKNLVYHASQVGWGAGVTSFAPTARDLVLLHYFKEHEGLWLPPYKVSSETGMSLDAISFRVASWKRREPFIKAVSVTRDPSYLSSGLLFTDLTDNGRIKAA